MPNFSNVPVLRESDGMVLIHWPISGVLFPHTVLVTDLHEKDSLISEGKTKREAAVQSNRWEESVLVVMNLSNWIQELKPKPWKKWREDFYGSLP